MQIKAKAFVGDARGNLLSVVLRAPERDQAKSVAPHALPEVEGSVGAETLLFLAATAAVHEPVEVLGAAFVASPTKRSAPRMQEVCATSRSRRTGECRSADVDVENAANVQRDVVVDEDLDERVDVAHFDRDGHCHTPFALT